MLVGLQKFHVTGPVGHIDLNPKLGCPGGRLSNGFPQFPLQAKQRARIGDTDIEDLARVVRRMR